MEKGSASRGWLWARTLYLLFAVGVYWVSRLSQDACRYGTVFIMAPWTVLLMGSNLARRQVKWDTYHILLFAAVGIYTAAALRNGNLSLRGLAVLALGLATVWTGVRGFTEGSKVLKACAAVLALALAALLLTVVCKFFGRGDLLPWVGGTVGSRSRAASHASMLKRSQDTTLRGLTNLLYTWGALLVAGILPREADAAHLRRESRILCLFTLALVLAVLTPAVTTVFTGRPIEAKWFEGRIGIQLPGLVADRIWALQHPNNGALWAVVGLFCAIYALHGETRRWLKALLWAAIVLLLMALAHCQSRTNDIALGVIVGAVAFHGVYLHFADRRWRVPLGLVAWGLTLALTILLVSGLFMADVFVANRIGAEAETNFLEGLRESAAAKRAEETYETDGYDEAVEVADGVVVPRTMAAGMFNFLSNGRGEIWRDCLDYLIHNPGDLLLGMGSGDLLERLKDYNPDRYHAVYMHSGYIEALMRGGVFMLAALAWALCLLVKPTARLLVCEDPSEPGKYLFAALIGVLLLVSLVESTLFTTATMYLTLFFHAAGRARFLDARETVPAN